MMIGWQVCGNGGVKGVLLRLCADQQTEVAASLRHNP